MVHVAESGAGLAGCLVTHSSKAAVFLHSATGMGAEQLPKASLDDLLPLYGPAKVTGDLILEFLVPDGTHLRAIVTGLVRLSRQ